MKQMSFIFLGLPGEAVTRLKEITQALGLELDLHEYIRKVLSDHIVDCEVGGLIE